MNKDKFPPHSTFFPHKLGIKCGSCKHIISHEQLRRGPNMMMDKHYGGPRPLQPSSLVLDQMTA